MKITLRKITRDTLHDILRLRVKPDQEKLVASNSVSIAKTCFYEEAWIRAIYAGETPVGFVMLHDENLREKPEERNFYGLWRPMIDADHQGKGYGRHAMKLVIAHVKSNPNALELLTSYVPGEGSAEGFYTKLGFEHTGKETHGEAEMRLKLR